MSGPLTRKRARDTRSSTGAETAIAPRPVFACVTEWKYLCIPQHLSHKSVLVASDQDIPSLVGDAPPPPEGMQYCPVIRKVMLDDSHGTQPASLDILEQHRLHIRFCKHFNLDCVSLLASLATGRVPLDLHVERQESSLIWFACTRDSEQMLILDVTTWSMPPMSLITLPCVARQERDAETRRTLMALSESIDAVRDHLPDGHFIDLHNTGKAVYEACLGLW